MKSTKIAIFLLFLPFYGYPQLPNYIGNPGFEDFEGNYWDLFDSNTGKTYSCVGPTISGYEGDGTRGVEKYWSFVPYWEVPKNRSFCQSLPTPDILGGGINSSNAHSGSFYASVGNGEYFCQEMQHQMVDNHEYYIQYYGKDANSQKAGLGFSNLRPEICDHYFINSTVLWLDGFPTNANDFPQNNQYSGTGNWDKIVGYYYPSGNKNWMTVGVFGSSNASNQVAYGLGIDDIKIYDMGENQGCPADRNFENTDFNDLNILFRASNLISAGYDIVANNDITGPVTVESNSNVTFRAGNEIALLDGFCALPGSNFSAYISPCECNPIWSNAGESFSMCGQGQTHLIGMSNITNATEYQWDANPPEALAYLSDPTVSNPTFTGPANPVAQSFTYTLNVKGQCFNQVSSSSIGITYSDQMPATNSTFTNLIATYSPSTQKIEISALTGDKTLEVKVEIYIGSILQNSYTLQRDDEFPDGTINYIPNEVFSDCNDYIIKIYGRNVCYDNFGDAFEYFLDLPSSQNLNLISPVAPNLSNIWVQEGSTNFCVTTEGAKTIILEILSSYGTILHTISQSTSVTLHETCIWNGSDGNLNAGWYPFILTILGCNNETIEEAGSFQYNASNKLEENHDSTNVKEENLLYFINPNPNMGQFTLTQTPNYIKKYQILNLIGQNLQGSNLPQGITELDINMNSLPKGIYIIQLETTDGIKVERIVYQ